MASSESLEFWRGSCTGPYRELLSPARIDALCRYSKYSPGDLPEHVEASAFSIGTSTHHRRARRCCRNRDGGISARSFLKTGTRWALDGSWEGRRGGKECVSRFRFRGWR